MAHVVLQLGTGLVLPFRSRRRRDAGFQRWKAEAVQKVLGSMPEWTGVGLYEARGFEPSGSLRSWGEAALAASPSCLEQG